MNHSSELTEHNMKIIIHSLRDYTINHNNADVGNLCLAILVNLCLKNDAAKYLITRMMKQTVLKEKIKNISDNLVAFKYFVLIEDEIFSNDVKYFIELCLKDVKTSVATFNNESINHSLDVLDHIDKAEVRLEFSISDEEILVGLLKQLNTDLMERISEEDSPKKHVFFLGVFNLYNVLLNLDPSLVTAFEQFMESAFLSPVSKSANALKFLSTFVNYSGTLGSSEIIIEGLVEHFAGNPAEDDLKISFDQKCAFLCLLEPLQEKSKLSEVHLTTIGNYFTHIVDTFKSSNLSALREDEIFFFIYFVFALSSVAKSNPVFYGKLHEVLKLDFLAMLMAKGHASKNKDILEILFKLAAVENFPNKKVSSLLSRCNKKLAFLEEKPMLRSRSGSDITTKLVAVQLAEEMEQLIARINEKMESGDINNVATNDLLQIFRQRNDVSNDQLMSVNEALDQSMFEYHELKQKIGTMNSLMSKQDFMIWCLQLDKERLIGEAKESMRVVGSLKSSIDIFQKKLDKKEASIYQSEKMLQLKVEEIKGEVFKGLSKAIFQIF